MKRSRALIAALVLSALAHALTLTGGWLHMPADIPEASPRNEIVARLQPMQKSAEIPPAPAPAPTAKPKPVARSLIVATAPQRAVSDTPSPFTLPPATTFGPAQSESTPDFTQNQTPTAEPVVVANAAPSTFAPEPAAIRNLPRRGRIAYNLYVGTNRFQAGRTVQSWEASADTYQLESTSETSGLVSLFRTEQRNFRSSGRVTERGLLPENFVSRRVRSSSTDEAVARFDWTKQSITLGRGAAQRSTPLPTGSQDMLSLMFQFSLAPPPPGRLQIAVTNGSRFENWEIDVLPEETIETPLGSIKALPLRPVRRQGAESMDIWLAADYRYLPVRIRTIGRDGEPTGELLVTEIRINEE